MKLSYVVVPLILGLLLAPVFANRGSIGVPGIFVEEPGQRAIVAWNGTEEVIILSTDMKSSRSAVILEVIPLPSNPTVGKGSSQSFVTLARLLNDKVRKRESHEKVEITFHQKIGAHDVTVVKVNDVPFFVEWVTQFSQEKGIHSVELPSDFEDVVSHYVDKSFNYFVFDVIEVNTSVQSVQPLVYQFRSHYLYYPLEITAASAVGESYSKVTVFLITHKAIDTPSIRERYPHMVFSDPVEFTWEELNEVSPELGDLFEGPGFVVSAFYAGPLHVLTNDIGYPAYESADEPELSASAKTISAAFSRGEEPTGHTRIIVVLWIIVLLLVLVAVNRSP